MPPKPASPQPASQQSTGNPAALWDAAMRAGDWPTAWRISDAILAARPPHTRDDPTLPYHLRWVWDGTPPDRLPTLVRCYHGLGDTIQFARYLAPLRRRAAHLTLEAPAPLAALLAPLADRVIPFDEAAPLPPLPCTLEIMELAHALRLPPPPPPYLEPPISTPAIPPRIGLCWQAGNWDPARSIPLPLLRPLADLEIALVSLQRGPPAAAALAPGAPPFLNPHDRSLDIPATTRLLASLATLVTVDTFVAHLAGSLGLPALVLLRHTPDWRWPATPTAAPWYPTLRLARQARPGDWSAPIAFALDHVSVITASRPSRVAL